MAWYYPSGHIRKTEFYKVAKLQGDVITYAEDGRIVSKTHYEGGQAIDTGKYAVSPNSPLVGRWNYVKLNNFNASSLCNKQNPPSYCIEYTAEWTIHENGTSDFKVLKALGSSETQDNWKYSATGRNTGVLEEFQGENRIGKCNVHLFSRNDFECAITFSPDPDIVGQRRHYVRE